MISPARHVLLVFVDGLGMAPASAHNPLQPALTPHLCRLLAEVAEPIDACLGVDGIPQSATGQATMLSGVNMARRMGRHIEGFPGPELSGYVEESNIFKQVVAAGGAATFANAYYCDSMEEVRALRFKSVTTVSTLSGVGKVRLTPKLHANRAIHHEPTRRLLVERGYAGPTSDPADAADHLIDIATDYSFTLYEFFRSDHAGHARDPEMVADVLGVLDRFVGRLVERLSDHEELLFVLTSDHGNIEDLSVPGHTRNPVPLIALGPGADGVRQQIHSIQDVTPAIMTWLQRDG
jgi:2,3-bisphosphoglycerate-independent phosphoglycerate mutase